MYPRSNCMPSTYSVSNCRPLDSSTVMTPSLPTLSITSAIRSPISLSWAEIAATDEISSLVLMAMACLVMASAMALAAASMPRLSIIGLAPAARFFRPSVTMAWASTVDVVVPSPAMSLVLVAASLRSCAPMFSNGSASSISLATVTPSWVMVGGPNLRSRPTLRPLGPRVVATAAARTSTPALRRRRASSEKASCLAAIAFDLLFDQLGLVFEDGKDVALPQDEHLLAIDLEFGPGVLGKEHLVLYLDIHGNALNILDQGPRTHRETLPLLWVIL